MPRVRSAGNRSPSSFSPKAPPAVNGTARFRTAVRLSIEADSGSADDDDGLSRSCAEAASAPVPLLRTGAKLKLACE